jgi:FtsH-binding integral membrane protein
MDFTFLGGALFSCLTCLIIWGALNAIFGWHASWVYALLGALVFCGYILFDTSRIVHKFGYDDYIIAAIDLYLDIINLFLFILDLLGRSK